MPATLADVARRAGVSAATASRVLNESSYGVTAELRARVVAAADELQYVPNAHAQALARASTSTVGVIVHDVSDPYFSEITRGIQRVASRAGRLVMICNTYLDLDRELAYVRLLHAQRVEALIVAGAGYDDRAFSQKLSAQLGAFTAAGGRAVLVGRHRVAGDTVVADNTGGARAAAEALIALGHQRIGVINGPSLLTTTRDRLEGFRAMLGEAGLSLPQTHIVEADFSRDGGLRATEELIQRAPDLTAIFALNDTMAVGALAALRERGIVVPEEISVVGFDDIPITRDITPMLSTVHVPMVEMGVRAMELALEPHASEWRFEHFPTTLVLRESTAAITRSGNQ
ncbi:MAG TPA: LacI family DNA-binding transcriptional regulator [Herpetosiphonaceae bacterium]|nr:LacI family DNA-binding transcriptional regulator [Herpetosiphonaceae bacterium]